MIAPQESPDLKMTSKSPECLKNKIASVTVQSAVQLIESQASAEYPEPYSVGLVEDSALQHEEQSEVHRLSPTIVMSPSLNSLRPLAYEGCDDDNPQSRLSNKISKNE